MREPGTASGRAQQEPAAGAAYPFQQNTSRTPQSTAAAHLRCTPPRRDLRREPPGTGVSRLQQSVSQRYCSLTILKPLLSTV
ncbi:hypothetical protein NDU88_001617 [Pleurodeles waltl]|uniref:Uncharacterized protein n=1 Tax=Pleurodeles waltl TaxID=8319 RepID=A0AAV7P7R7_PLEWA|nr:hypothetical protein NDU88_001617 [Pleurodeles waltl]